MTTRTTASALALMAQTGPVLADGPRVAFGAGTLDARIGGGLIRNGLHEIYAAAEDSANVVAGFAVMLALRALNRDDVLFWIREDRSVRGSGRLFAPGLAELGCDPAAFVLVTAADTLGLLRAAADALKCSHVGAVVIEPWAKAPLLDLTASRRLAMAAASSCVFTLVARADASPAPSAAQTRWEVASAPSLALAADTPGHPAFNIKLLRHRSGIAGLSARLEWNRDTRCFMQPLAQLPRCASAAAVTGADRPQRQAV